MASVITKAAARDALAGLDASPGQFAAANRAIARATSNSSIDLVQSGSDLVVRLTRPGLDGYQVIQTTISTNGAKSVVQLAYDSDGHLVHYDPKTP